MSFVKRFQHSLESLTSLADISEPNTTRYVVAYSGGVDSHVLLHCAKQAGLTVRAVHIHHGLQKVADDWVLHCQQVCQQLTILLQVIYVDAQKKSGDSPEESARNARYQALHDNMQAGECLLTAQHINDQAETLLLQLFRSGSSAGLSAMPSQRQFGDFLHTRPLLSFSREEIEAYATDNHLSWVEDPSNKDLALDRNFLRKEIVPALQKRWPEVVSQLSTVAALQANNLKVLEDMAAIDLANVSVLPKPSASTPIVNVVSMLSIDRLKQLSSPRLLNILRYWIIGQLKKQPTRNLLQELEKTLLHSSEDARPLLAFSGFIFTKFNSRLCLIEAPNALPDLLELNWQPDSQADSQPGSVINIAELNIQLEVIEVTNTDQANYRLDNSLRNKKLTIRFRQGGESFHPAGRQHSQRLKKLFQEAGIPPWERDVTPLLYDKDELIAVLGNWLSKKHLADDGEAGWQIVLKKY
jgi:tRNA(Ile)-lysidine synthase